MTAVELLSAAGDLEAARLALDRVFVSTNPFAGNVFHGSIASRALGFGLSWYDLTDEQWDVFSRAARSVDEDVVYLLETEDEWGIWRIRTPFPDPYRDAEGWTSVRENAIVAGSGRWGLTIAHTGHCLLGGPEAFVAAIREALPVFSASSVADFVDFWSNVHRENPDLDVRWVAATLAHVLGEPEALRMLADTGLRWEWPSDV